MLIGDRLMIECKGTGAEKKGVNWKGKKKEDNEGDEDEKLLLLMVYDEVVNCPIAPRTIQT